MQASGRLSGYLPDDAAPGNAAGARPPRGLRVLAEGFGLWPGGAGAPVLEDVDFAVEPGEVVLLAGASGVGKSTLLHALAGLLSEESGPGSDPSWDAANGDDAEAGHESLAFRGTLLVDDTALFPEPGPGLAGRVGLVQQDPETQVVMSRIGDDVAFGAENLGLDPALIWPRVREALDAVGLGDFPLNHPSSSLSGGQKQRLAVAGLLAMRPGLWLLDEPTANLDPDGAAEVRDVVLATARTAGATVLIVEHRVDLWADGIDRIVVLGRPDAAPGVATSAERAPGARVIADGAPSEVLGDPRAAARLAAGGVWVPGHRPPLADWVPASAGDALLVTEALAATRERVPRSRGARRRALAAGRVRAAVSDVGLNLAAGRAVALVGPNGAGKTSLALTLAGLQRPAAGRVVASPDLAAGARGDEPSRWRASELVTRLGVVFQDPEHQFVARTVRDELAHGPRRTGTAGKEADGRVDELLRRLHLTEQADVNPFQLSGGQKRRLSVGTALATRPRVLVLDEPTFGQDSVTWAELVALLREELDRGTCVVAVTHDDGFVRALGADVVRVDGGRAEAGGRTEAATAPSPAPGREPS